MSKIALGTRKGHQLRVGDLLYGTSSESGEITMIWEIAEFTAPEEDGLGYRNCRATVVWTRPDYARFDHAEAYRSVSVTDNVDYTTEVPEVFATSIIEDPR